MSQFAIYIDRLSRTPWLIAVVVVLSCFWQIGAGSLSGLQEAPFAATTQAMLAQDSLLIPYADGHPDYGTPPLGHWLQIVSASLFGFGEAALRLPSALAVALLVVVVWRFGRASLDELTAVTAASTLALSLGMSLLAKTALADAAATLFIALTCLEAYRFSQAPERGTLLRAYAWMALGFLTKGPLAIVFPVLVSLLFFWSIGAPKTWLRGALAPWGWLVFVLIAGPWFALVYLGHGVPLTEALFLEHNLKEFGGVLGGQGGLFGYYFLILPLILLPFTGWFVQLLPNVRDRWADPLDRLLLLWFLCVFAVLSVLGTSLLQAMLYGTVPLFILLARHRDLLINRALAFGPPIAVLVALFFLSELLALTVGQFDGPHFAAVIAEVRQRLDLVYYVAVLGCFGALGFLWRWHEIRAWQGLLVVGLLQAILFNGILMPRFDDAVQAPVKEAALLAKESGLPTVVYRTSSPGFDLYLGAAVADRPPRPGDLVFLRIDKAADLTEALPQLEMEERYQRGAFALIFLKRSDEPD